MLKKNFVWCILLIIIVSSNVVLSENMIRYKRINNQFEPIGNVKNQIMHTTKSIKQLTTLQVILLGIRKFSELLSKTIPSEESMTVELSKNKDLIVAFRTFFIGLHNFADAMVKSLTIPDRAENRQMTLSPTGRIFSSLRTFFVGIRNIAGQALVSYNYYFPEISFTRCVGRFIQREYPNMSTRSTLETTMKIFTGMYEFLSDSIRGYFRNTNTEKEVGEKIAAMTTEIDMKDLSLQSQPQQIYDQKYYLENLKSLYTKNNNNLEFENQRPIENLHNEMRASRKMDSLGEISAKNHIMYGFAGPRAFIPPVVGPLFLTTPSPMQTVPVASPTNQEPTGSDPSFFDFDDTIEEELGIQESDEDKETFQKCTQEYAVELFWRSLEDFLLRN